MTARFVSFFHWIGAFIFEQAHTYGLFFKFLKDMFFHLPHLHKRRREILQMTVQFGVESLPIIVIATVFAGLVITHEIAWHMDLALGNTSMVPGFTGQFIVRELGIVIPAFLMVSRVGASITAEVSTMKITEQLDALKLLRIDPIGYLIFPRWIGFILSLNCLTLISVFTVLFFATTMAVIDYNFSYLEYLSQLRHFVRFSDFVITVIKSTAFGMVIPLVSCSYGFRCRGGAQEVGLATTQSVVASTVSVIVLDFIITLIFNWMH